METLLQDKVVNIQNFLCLAIQFDEGVEHRGAERAGKGRVCLGDARNIIGDPDGLVAMQGAEKKHVPVARQLPDGGGKPGLQLIVKYDVVLKNEHAGYPKTSRV